MHSICLSFLNLCVMIPRHTLNNINRDNRLKVWPLGKMGYMYDPGLRLELLEACSLGWAKRLFIRLVPMETEPNGWPILVNRYLYKYVFAYS